MSDSEDDFQSADEWEGDNSSVKQAGNCGVKTSLSENAGVGEQSVESKTTQPAHASLGDPSVKASSSIVGGQENREMSFSAEDLTRKTSQASSTTTQGSDTGSTTIQGGDTSSITTRGIDTGGTTIQGSDTGGTTTQGSDTSSTTTRGIDTGGTTIQGSDKQKSPNKRQKKKGGQKGNAKGSEATKSPTADTVRSEDMVETSTAQEVCATNQQASDQEETVLEEKQEVEDDKLISTEEQKLSQEEQEIDTQLIPGQREILLKDSPPSDSSLDEPTHSDTSTSGIDQSTSHKALEQDSQQPENIIENNEIVEVSAGSLAYSGGVGSSPAANAVPEKMVLETGQSENEGREVSRLFDELSIADDGKKQSPRDSREESVLEKLSVAGEQKKQSAGWSSWGSWGSTLLSTATSSINTFTGQVSQGMHTVVETFEASVGAPPATELASDISKHVKEPDDREPNICAPEASAGCAEGEEDTSEHVAVTSNEPSEVPSGATAKAEENSDWFASWGVSELTNQLHSKTKGLVESGLDVLETIGKKTMEQIKETDPGYVKTKGLLGGNATNLSQALREAKEKNEKKAVEESNTQSLVNYSTLFDEHKGLLSLEALELLSISATEMVSSAQDISEQMQLKLDTLSEKFNAVHDCEEDSGDDNYNFATCLNDITKDLGLPIKFERIVGVQQQCRSWLDDCLQRQEAGERIDGLEIHKAALNSFAEVTSCAMELYHKSAVLLSHDMLGDQLIGVDSVHSCFVSILRLVNGEITQLSHKYNECLNTAADDSENPDSINPMIVDVFLEASNSASYVRDAFKLLLPILQCFELTSRNSDITDDITDDLK